MDQPLTGATKRSRGARDLEDVDGTQDDALDNTWTNVKPRTMVDHAIDAIIEGPPVA